ncbi:MAG: hypothetical protein ACOX5R_08925 [bacterium]
MKLRGTMFLFSLLILPLYHAAAVPIYQVGFEAGSLEANGWAATPVFGGDFTMASVTIGPHPVNPPGNFAAGERALRITASGGQAALVYGPAINVGNSYAIIRFQVYASSGGGTLAIGGLNTSTDSISGIEGSTVHDYQTDSQVYVGQYYNLSVLMKPKHQRLIPIVQLVVQSGRSPVTVVVDQIEVYRVDTNLVQNPELQQVLGLTGGGNNPTPPPTPPPSGAQVFVDDIIPVTPQDDPDQGMLPEVEFDTGSVFALISTEIIEGYQDIIHRNVDIRAETDNIRDAVRVNDSFENVIATDPDVGITSGGSRLVVWTDNRGIDETTNQQLYSIFLEDLNPFNGFEPAGSNDDYEVNEAFQDTNAYAPSISVQSNSNFAVTWYDNRYVDQGVAYNDIFLQRMHFNGTNFELLDNRNIQVNIPRAGTNSYDPDVAVTDSGTVAVTWSDNRVLINNQRRRDVYARVFQMGTQAVVNAAGGLALPDSVPEASLSDFDDATFDHALTPRIAHSGGYFLVVWTNENDNGKGEIRAAVLNDTGSVIHLEFIIDDDENVDVHAPSVAGYGNGQFLITWHDELNHFIYAILYDANEHMFLTDYILMIEGSVQTQQTSTAISPDLTFLIGFDSVFENLYDLFTISGEISDGQAAIQSFAKPMSIRKLASPKPRSVKSAGSNISVMSNVTIRQADENPDRELKPKRMNNLEKEMRIAAPLKHE